MSRLVRRDFLKLGAAGVTGIAVSDALASPRPPIRPSKNVNLEYAFLFEPGASSRIDTRTNRLFGTTPWAIPSEFAHLAPALLSPISADPDELQAWADGENGNSLGALMQVPINGLPDVTDIIGDASVALAEGQRLNLTLKMLHFDSRELKPGYAVYNPSGIPVLEKAGAPRLPESGAQLTPAAILPSPTLFGWKIVFHGPETGKFGTCVPVPVRHFNVELHRQKPNQPSRYDQILNFHVGTYREGTRRCFALWQNKAPRVLCIRRCLPTRNDLVDMFKAAVLAAAAIAGVSLAAWTVAAIAEAGATVIYVPLLLLAI